MRELPRYIISAFFSLVAVSGEVCAQTQQSLTGLWYNADNRLATVEIGVFRQHCRDGRLIWLRRLETRSSTEWEIYTGSWRIAQNALIYEINLFERAQSPTYAISRKTKLTSSFEMLVGRVDSDRFEFERQWGFPPRVNVAKRVDALPLPNAMRDKASCEQATS